MKKLLAPAAGSLAVLVLSFSLASADRTAEVSNA